MREASEAEKKFSKPSHYKSNVFTVRSIKKHVRKRKEFCSFIIPTLDRGSGVIGFTPRPFYLPLPIEKEDGRASETVQTF
jgi:hypothetical protein